ncbi:MAG TPA: hypothetical protein VN923_11765, partial [Thermoanaerobaculia bacterium]|nr:hypothetical protein [Thermoanaerobaculia bacterium]
AAAAWLAFAVHVGIARRGQAIDDFFITFHYAQNLADGYGLVFNPGERVFGTTAPGYALALGALAAATRLPVPWLGEAATVLGLVLLALLGAAAARSHRGEAILGGTLVVTSTYIWLHHGGETAVVLALLAAAGAAAERRPGVAGLLAALATWSRPDALIGAAGLGALLWWRRRRIPWRYAIVLGVVVVIGLLAAWWWFGQPLPGTLEAKRAQAEWSNRTWPSGWRFWIVGYQFLATLSAGRLLPLLLLVGLAGQALVFRRAPLAIQAVALYGLVVTVAYPLLGVPFYTWYAIPGLVAVLYGTAYLLGEVARTFATQRLLRARATAAIAASMIVVALVRPLQDSWHVLREPRPYDDRYWLYRSTGEWLAAHTRPDERVAAGEVGTIGYYARRPITDVMGLVSPEVLGRVRKGDMAGAFLRHPTEVVIDGAFFRLRAIVQQPWFPRKYELAAQLGDDIRWTRIYRLKPGEELPRRRRAFDPNLPAPRRRGRAAAAVLSSPSPHP